MVLSGSALVILSGLLVALWHKIYLGSFGLGKHTLSSRFHVVQGGCL